MATLSFREKSNENFGKAVITTVKDPSDELVVIEGKLSQKFTKLLKGQNKPEQYFNLEGLEGECVYFQSCLITFFFVLLSRRKETSNQLLASKGS